MSFRHKVCLWTGVHQWDLGAGYPGVPECGAQDSRSHRHAHQLRRGSVPRLATLGHGGGHRSRNAVRHGTLHPWDTELPGARGSRRGSSTVPAVAPRSRYRRWPRDRHDSYQHHHQQTVPGRLSQHLQYHHVALVEAGPHHLRFNVLSTVLWRHDLQLLCRIHFSTDWLHEPARRSRGCRLCPAVSVLRLRTSDRHRRSFTSSHRKQHVHVHGTGRVRIVRVLRRCTQRAPQWVSHRGATRLDSATVRSHFHCGVFARYKPHLVAAYRRAVSAGISRSGQRLGHLFQLCVCVRWRQDLCWLPTASWTAWSILVVRGNIHWRALLRGMLRSWDEGTRSGWDAPKIHAHVMAMSLKQATLIVYCFIPVYSRLNQSILCLGYSTVTIQVNGWVTNKKRNVFLGHNETCQSLR